MIDNNPLADMDNLLLDFMEVGQVAYSKQNVISLADTVKVAIVTVIVMQNIMLNNISNNFIIIIVRNIDVVIATITELNHILLD